MKETLEFIASHNFDGADDRAVALMAKVLVHRAKEALAQPVTSELLGNPKQLAQPEQEPVAWAVIGEGKFGEYKIGRETESNLDALKYWTNRDYSLVPLYASPPKRPWVGLTDDDMPTKELDAFCRGARWADAKLKELNTCTPPRGLETP